MKLQIKGLTELGELEGYAAYKGNVDSYGDIIENGSMKRTIRNNKNFPLLFGHDVNQPIGLTTFLREDENGLYMKAQLDLENDIARRVYSGVKNGYITGLSIGYQVIKDDVNKKGNRLLKEIKLFEISLVTKGFAANPLANVSGFKSIDFEDRIKRLEDRFIKSEEERDEEEVNINPILERIEELEQQNRDLQNEVKQLADSLESTRPFLMPQDPDESTLENKSVTDSDEDSSADDESVYALLEFKKYLKELK